MDFILFDNKLVSSTHTSSLLSNRGFLYGDGFFETICIRNAHVFFLEDHVERALLASTTLMMDDHIKNTDSLFIQIKKIWAANKKPNNAIVKCMVWRNSEGLYEPSTNKAHMILELKPFREAKMIKQRVGIAENTFNVKTIHSAFKSLSALHYVLAGLEKKQKHFDEILLLDQAGNISEANSSALFWIHDNEVFTPSLDTGCIEGITRKKIIRLCQAWNIALHEVKTAWTSIPKEAMVFTANIAGLSAIAAIEDRAFQLDHALFQRFKEGLFSPSFSQNLETVN